MSEAARGAVATAASAPAADAVRLRVPDMDCPSCVAKIESHLRRQRGVVDVQGNAVSRTLVVRLDRRRTDLPAVRAEVGRLGYSAVVDEDPAAPPRVGTWATRQAHVAYASAALFAAGLLLRWVAPARAGFGLPDLLLLASAAVGGWNFFPKGIRAVRAGALDMNFLMTVAILGAVALGEYVEGAAIAFLFAIAELLESYAVDRARASVERLLDLAPETARVVRGGREVTVPAAELRPGDVVAVRPGERVAADAEVVDGASAVDESTLTGEAVPVAKGVGDRVFAGTINREGFLRARVDRSAQESTLARIIRLVEEAEGRKTRTERFVERFARVYTPAVAVGAVLVVAVPTLLFGAPVAPWLLRGLTLLVIACPCALVISTPVAVVSGITAAARHGVLFKGGVYLEALGDAPVMAFDKTGTLTVGHLRVVEVRPAPGGDAGALLARAAAVEARSEHPVARALVEAAAERGAAGSRWSVTGFAAVPGRGARAALDGVEHAVGSPAFLGVADAVPDDLAVQGRTVVAVTARGEVLGWIALADGPRPGAAEALRALRASGVGRLVMLTGDNPRAARAVAQGVGGLDEVRAGLLPEDKVDAVKELEARHGAIVMVGDGVNDAPALAAATVGVAMGAAGSDTALETADVALMGDDLDRLVYARALSRKARRVIRQNVAVSLLVKGVLAAGVPLGLVSLIGAVLVGDMGISLAVTLNALRLGRVSSA